MPHTVKNILIITTLFFICFTGRAQSPVNLVIIETKVHTGIVVPLYKALSYLIDDDVYAFDLTVSFPTYGKDFWEKLYNYPRPGAGYSFWTLGNNDVFGKAHALYGFVNMPIIKRSEKFSLNYQISMGGAYLTKRFDISENHINRAVSTHINIFFRFGIDSKIKLSPRSELVIEAGGTHFSNGKIKTPNYGLNAGTLSLGFNHLIGNKPVIIQEPEIPETVKLYEQSLFYSAGVKVYDNLLDYKYFTSSFSYNLERILNHRRRIGLGADLFYDSSINEALAVEEGNQEDEFRNLIRAGLHVSYAARYKQVIMGIQAGHYFYSKYTVLTKLYTRLSVQYMLSEHLSAGLTLRSHFGKADCMELGMGYYW
jgi:hypothetical protein